MEPIREAEMQTQPGKRLNEEPKKNGKVWKIVVGVVAAPWSVKPLTSTPLMAVWGKKAVLA